MANRKWDCADGCTGARIKGGVLLAGVLAAAASALMASPVSAQSVTVMIGINQDENWQAAIDRFTKLTGIDVNVVAASTGDDMRQKLPIMVASGVGPDVVFHETGVQSDLVEKGVVQPIDSLVAANHLDLSIWPKPLLDALRYNGQLYSLPAGVSAYATYYNVDKFADAGLSPLPTDWNAPGFTYDDMAAMARKLTKDLNGDGTPEQYGLEDFLTMGERSLVLWNQRWLSEDRKQYLGDDPAVIDTITKVKALWLEDRSVGGSFTKGTAAMIPQQPYILNHLIPKPGQSGAFRWSMAVLPKGECRCAAAGFWSWGLVKGSKNPEAAWAFIRYMATDPQGALYFNRVINRTPVLRSVQQDYVARWNQLMPGMHAEVLTDGVSHVVREPMFAGVPITVYSTINDALKKVVAGQAAPKEALSAIRPAVEAILAKTQPAP